MSANPFDTLLAAIQVEDTYAIEDHEEAAQALLATLQPDRYASPFSHATSDLKQRVTTPVYEPPATYQKSAPFPTAFKANVNTKKGIVTAYLTTYLGTDGQPYIDPYNDIIHDTAFVDTLKQLEAQRKHKGNDWLVPDLWQHDKKEIIGGIKGITLDRHGPIYEAHLFMGVQRARECLEICERKACGSSFGYDAVDFDHDLKGIRHLKAVKLHEVSQVSFPANSLAPILDVKSRFYMPSTYSTKPATHVNRQAIKAVMQKASALFDQLTKQMIKAHEQYKWEAELNKPRVRRI